MFIFRLSCAIALILFVAIPAHASPACKVADVDIATEYSGPCDNGYAQGKGRARGRDTYEGDFLGGKKSGKGIYVWGQQAPQPGARYEGAYANDRRNGFGILTDSYGTYRGEWRDGLYHGKGTLTFNSGAVKKGDFIMGKYVDVGASNQSLSLPTPSSPLAPVPTKPAPAKPKAIVDL